MARPSLSSLSLGTRVSADGELSSGQPTSLTGAGDLVAELKPAGGDKQACLIPA